MIKMTKNQVINEFLTGMRLPHEAKYLWENNVLMAIRKESDLFGYGNIEIEEPVYLRWKGEPVEIVDEINRRHNPSAFFHGIPVYVNDGVPKDEIWFGTDKEKVILKNLKGE